MKVFMQAHGVWEAIEPKDLKTTLDEKMDKRALAIIYQGIADDMLLTIAEKKTSKEAWGEIKTLCLSADKVKKAKAQTLKSEFESLKMALGETIDEEYVVKMLLGAVQTKFLQIASSIEKFGNLDTMSVEEIIEDEWLKRESNDGKLLLTREEWLKRSGKDAQGSGGDYHVRDNRMVRNRSQVKCFNCGAYSHFVNECRKPRKNRQQRGKANLAQVNNEEPALLMAMCDNGKKDVTVVIEGKTTNTIKERDDNIWYLDNGDINHMTGHREKLEKLDKTVKGEVKFGDDSLVKIEGKAMAAACQENWLQRVLSHIMGIKSVPVTLYIDNRSAVDLARNPVFHGRSKHIDLRYHCIRDCIEKGLIVIKHVRTNEQRADILTKALAISKFEKIQKLLGVRNLGNV
ncbi:uncharacterized protein LOC141700972 [Apium graveolens]|uniref:uncharacterized protein LOC141700972 n=1 Tax=Apium graveolens TaxID=4045 RepID=UPI003D7BDFD8